jgi:hypothetical protein
MSPIPTITGIAPALAEAVAEFNARIESPIEPSVSIEAIVEADPAAFTTLVVKAQADRFAALQQRVSLWRERGELLDQLSDATTRTAHNLKLSRSDAEVTARQQLADAGLTSASWKGEITSAHAWLSGPGSVREKAFTAEVVRRHPTYTDAAQRHQEAVKATTLVAAAAVEQTALAAAEAELVAFVTASVAAVVTPQSVRV